VNDLVLSIFPGIGLLDRAFESEGFCVVRGPDLFWGGNIHQFHPPVGKFDGVIGGPPCKGDSKLSRFNGDPGVDLRREFARCVRRSKPSWWLMEAVAQHDDLGLGEQFITTLSPRWLGHEQSRVRHFHSNLDLRRHVETAALEPVEYAYAVRAANRAGAKGTVKNRMATYTWPEMLRLQGLPDDFALPLLSARGRQEAIGNGVPIPVGRAIAQAVKKARVVA
jgi:DNA (cytosine-5)-methyltransferase 1